MVDVKKVKVYSTPFCMNVVCPECEQPTTFPIEFFKVLQTHLLYPNFVCMRKIKGFTLQYRDYKVLSEDSYCMFEGPVEVT